MATETPTPTTETRIEYRGYFIEDKRDFGTHGHFIDGKYVKEGFVVTDGGIINVMPGAAWFQTVQEAKDAIDVLILIKNESDQQWFWYALQRWDVSQEDQGGERIAVHSLEDMRRVIVERPIIRVIAHFFEPFVGMSRMPHRIREDGYSWLGRNLVFDRIEEFNTQIDKSRHGIVFDADAMTVTYNPGTEFSWTLAFHRRTQDLYPNQEKYS